MTYFQLGAATSRASMLAFGCASIMGYHDRRTSLRALHTAHDHGINFFDLARSYGYGQAESVFGEFARGRRAGIVITSKFGIRPDPAMRANAIRLLRGGLRGVRHLVMPRRAGADPHDAFSPHWSPGALRASVHQSVREIKTDHLDLLLLHSPPATITRRADLFEELDRLEAQGLIRAYGLSTDARRGSEALAHARHAIVAVQHPFCPLTGATDTLEVTPGPIVILNHVFGGRGALQNASAIVDRLRASRDLPEPTREKLGSAGASTVVGDVLLNGALAATRAQCAVVSMFSTGHIAQNCAVVARSRFTEAELLALVAHLGGKPGPGQHGP